MRTKIHSEAGAPHTWVTPRLTVQLPITVELTEFTDEELPTIERIEFKIDLIGEHQIRPTEITVKAKKGYEVRSTDLRDIQVNKWAVHAVALKLMQSERLPGGGIHGFVGGPTVAFSEDEQAQIRADGPVESSLRTVADIYLFADAVGRPPAKQVELQLGLPRTTASKWIRRAREAGLLGGEV